MITGSAMRKLEAITGLIVRKEKVGYSMTVSPGVAYYSRKQDEKEACKELREQNWRRVCQEVFKLQGWKCGQCEKVKPLQGHHYIFRSRWSRSDGPLDHPKNVIGMCAECHAAEHGPAKSKTFF